MPDSGAIQLEGRMPARAVPVDSFVCNGRAAVARGEEMRLIYKSASTEGADVSCAADEPNTGGRIWLHASISKPPSLAHPRPADDRGCPGRSF